MVGSLVSVFEYIMLLVYQVYTAAVHSRMADARMWFLYQPAIFDPAADSLLRSSIPGIQVRVCIHEYHIYVPGIIRYECTYSYTSFGAEQPLKSTHCCLRMRVCVHCGSVSLALEQRIDTINTRIRVLVLYPGLYTTAVQRWLSHAR